MGRNHAVVTLVMRGDKYVPGALVMGQSCRKAFPPTSSSAPSTSSVPSESGWQLVCMVTSDVSEQAQTALRLVFDRVVVVEYLEASCVPMATEKQEKMYGAWISAGFTKWRCLELVEYDKVLFMDSDTLILRDLSHLFTSLRAPAATFSLPWASPFKNNGLPNPYARLGHGDRVPREAIETGLRSSFVGMGTTILLTPSRPHLAALVALISNPSPYGSRACKSGFDEQAIMQLYCTLGIDYHHIHQRYNYIPWHKQWLSPRDGAPEVFHFFNNKPWELARSMWPDLESWWQMADVLVQEHPALRQFFDASNLSPEFPLVDPPQCHYCASLHRRSTGHQIFNAEGRLVCPELSH